MSSTTASNTSSAAANWRGFKAAALPKVPAWVETLGRFGHIAKGVVYFIIGFLAFRLAIGAGGEISGARDALREIGQQPYGHLLLGLMATGLLGYTAWRWVEATKSPDLTSDGWKKTIKRIGYAVSGLLYLSLGCYAGSLALGWGSLGGGSQSGQVSSLLSTTWGRWTIGIVGVITAAAGLYFISKGYEARFMRLYQLGKMSKAFRKVALHAGRVGLITRGIAVVIVGGFLVVSAYRGTSEEVTGIEDALAVAASQPFGMILLGVAGFGFMAYAVHMILLGWYRRFNVTG